MRNNAVESSPNGTGGWGIVSLGFLILALAFTARGSLSLAMPIWQEEFGWSRSFVSGIASWALLVMAAVAPFAGRLVDRSGSRRLLAFGLGAIGAGIAVAAAAQPGMSWLLPLGFAGIGAVGFGIVAQHVVAAAIAQRFVTHRGLAVGIGTAGSTAGLLVMMPILAYFVQIGDWRTPFQLLAAACFLLIPAVWFLLRDRPSVTSGHVAGDVVKSTPGGEQGSPRSFWPDLRALARQPVFHIIFWSYTLCGFTTSGVIETHLLPYASLCGFPPVPSATAYGLLSALNLVGMITAGWLSDRWHRPRLLAIIYLVRAGAFILLMFVVGNYPLLVMFALIFGLVDYSTVPVTASYLASRLGIQALGLSMGLLAAGHAIGAAAGAWAGGIIFDHLGNYSALWIGSVAVSLIASLLVAGLSDNERLDRRAGQLRTA